MFKNWEDSQKFFWGIPTFLKETIREEYLHLKAFSIPRMHNTKRFQCIVYVLSSVEV